jgi:prepilin-type N-terminal cleavage/methylation domain-containing protein
VNRARPRRAIRGFTVIEMVVVVTVMGILAILAANQFHFLRARAQESTLRGHLGSIRGALLIYYGNMDGVYPAAFSALTENGKYLPEIPREDIPPVQKTDNPGHAGTRGAEQVYAVVPSSPGGFLNEGTALWGYVNNPKSGRYGHVFVNCAHRDTKSSVWTHW